MVRSEFTFLSADGKTPIHAVVWEPETAPVGVVQLDPARDAETERGCITLLCLPQEFRQRGFGVQLLGQAVAYYRPLGRKYLRAVLEPSDETGRTFFTRYGFADRKSVV